MPQADSFLQRCITGIEKFVQTAVVIDNEAYLDANEILLGNEKPHHAERFSGSILIPAVKAPSSTIDEDVASQQSGSAYEKTEIISRSSHTLDAKALTNAFHSLEIVCGVYKPVAGDEMVGLATKAAHHADIVIIDWFLDSSKTSTKAKDIVRSILHNDITKQGRLRLIAIYTGETNLPGLANELLRELDSDALLKKGKFQLSPTGYSLLRGDAKICFLNKLDAEESSKDEFVTVSDLPQRLLLEFAEVTEGLLANFAVTAIAEVRRAAHHVVALFRKELDGAYLAHRSRLIHPDEAKSFAAELVSDELGYVISMAGVADYCLNTEVIADWVDHVSADNRHVFKNHHDGKIVSVEKVNRLLAQGFASVKGTLGLPLKQIEGIFFESSKEAWKRSFEFARLASLKYEVGGRSGFPNAWAPILTLGTILRLVHNGEEPSLPYLPSDYLVCMQPLCHSVRLTGAIAFPFQTATLATRLKPEFNLVIRDELSTNLDLLVGWEPRDGAMFRFSPDLTRQIVIATRNEAGHYLFKDADGRTFLWLGDLKADKVHKRASELASHIHTIGTNEFEWLREARAQNKIDFDGRP